jgi:hypothetical protein
VIGNSSAKITLHSGRLCAAILPHEEATIALVFNRQSETEFLPQQVRPWRKPLALDLLSGFESSACAGMAPTSGTMIRTRSLVIPAMKDERDEIGH